MQVQQCEDQLRELEVSSQRLLQVSDDQASYSTPVSLVNKLFTIHCTEHIYMSVLTSQTHRQPQYSNRV